MENKLGKRAMASIFDGLRGGRSGFSMMTRKISRPLHGKMLTQAQQNRKLVLSGIVTDMGAPVGTTESSSNR